MLALSVGFILVYDYFTQTRRFEAKRIVVTGCQRLSEQEILDISGIKPGVNILSINLSTAKQRILNHPWVAKASISRIIPSELHIRIEEEEPLALLEISDGTAFLVNQSGQIFKQADGSDGDFRPRITGLDNRDLPAPGWPDTPSFQAAMEMFRLFRETGPPTLSNIPVNHIRMDPHIGATVYLGTEERAIVMGFGQYREKYAVLSGLLKQIEKDHRMAPDYQCIDLFDINRIVITPVPVELTRSVREEVSIAGT